MKYVTGSFNRILLICVKTIRYQGLCKFFTISNSDRSNCERLHFAFVDIKYLLKRTFSCKDLSSKITITCKMFTSGRFVYREQLYVSQKILCRTS